MSSLQPAAQGPPIIVIVGPTASGKSALGVALALRLGAEIINLDSVQVYRGLYIATAKISTAEMRGIPHHLIDIVEPTENFTAGDYARAATAKIAEIEAGNRYALLVGGTGFYLRALQGQLYSESQPTDLSLRTRLKALRERLGSQHLHRMLTRLDISAARQIQPNDWARTIRALEVYFQTGRSITEWQQRLPPPPTFAARICVFALAPPREALYQRINQRVEEMFANGLVAEVSNLLDAGVPWDAKAFGAHGYRRVIEYLKGQRGLESCIEQTKIDTRHYAKRQLTWWRHTTGVHWLNGFGGEDGMVEAVLAVLSHSL
ncbi:MAG: tRNA (adenosine(37)-N6)-dimethylallyltransferase MiaA [Acidobacteriota bacterium]